MKTCSSCGMSMLAEEDFAGSDPDSDLCVHCGQDSTSRGRLVSFAMLEAKLGKA
ncbi:MAG: AraC family transcriptional regulator, partial [Thermoleophilia bacterium]|nr:AraC family transcriptional regulator [Thermoleophilia bacterium]